MGKIERGHLRGSGYGEWMERRQTVFCDEVEPVHVDIVDGENVVWARRFGISDVGFFDFYHIGCDCLGSVPRGQSEIQAMLACSALRQVLLEAADTTARETFHLPQVLPHFTYEEDGETLLDGEGQNLAKIFVYEALARTIDRPDRCHGNIRSGVHAKPILQYMLGGVADSQLDFIVDSLHYQGLLTHDDPLVAIAL